MTTSYALTRSLFLRGLGLIYLFAFLSLPPQITGLIGSKGIRPACRYLEAIHSAYGSRVYSLLPTLAWVNCSDTFLLFVSWTGVALSLLLIVGVAPMFDVAALYVLYLSVMNIGQPFFPFQWDALLLEAGFAAILVTPFGWWPRWSTPMSSTIGIWVFRVLLFRLMLESGLSKILSGDPNWRNLTALQFHYETQPLPTPLAWYAHHLPSLVQKFSVGATFAIELAIPALFFMPRHLRKLRLAGAWITIGFQALIALTGNYTFFNLLTMVLCIPLFDDEHVRWLLRRPSEAASALEPRRSRYLTIPAGVALIALGAVQLPAMFGIALPDPVGAESRLQMFQIVNRYGLFAVMTTSRPEIVIEGSDDGQNWKAYEFKYKPGDVHRRLPWVAPYQPRLDWQMWFAALAPAQEEWLPDFLVRLQEGSPEVLGLMGSDPFPDHAPRHIRALLYDYHFTDRQTRPTSGAIWDRRLLGVLASR